MRTTIRVATMAAAILGLTIPAYASDSPFGPPRNAAEELPAAAGSLDTFTMVPDDPINLDHRTGSPLKLSLAQAGAPAATLAATTCDVEVIGRILAGGLPLKNAPLSLYDRASAGADTSPVTGTATVNRWLPDLILLGNARTDDDGAYFFCVERADTRDGTLDVYVQLTTEDPAVVTVTVPLTSQPGIQNPDFKSPLLTYAATTSEFHDVQGPVFDMGTWTTSQPGAYPPPIDDLPDCNIQTQSPQAARAPPNLVCFPHSLGPLGTVSAAFSIYGHIHFAAAYFRTVLNDPIPFVQVYYPENHCGAQVACYQRTGHTIHIPRQMAGFFINVHEYGHHVMSTKSADDSPGGAHIIHPQMGWSEGWADFMPSLVTSIATGSTSDSAGSPATGGEGAESNVQNALYDLFDVSNEPGDDATEPVQDFWTVFRADVPRAPYRPTSFCHFQQAWADRYAAEPAKVERLEGVASLNGIDC